MERNDRNKFGGKIDYTCKMRNQLITEWTFYLCTYQCQARGGSGNPREFDRDAYPQGGDFDLTSCIRSVNFKE